MPLNGIALLLLRVTSMQGIAHFRDFGDQKIQVGRDQKING